MDEEENRVEINFPYQLMLLKSVVCLLLIGSFYSFHTFPFRTRPTIKLKLKVSANTVHAKRHHGMHTSNVFHSRAYLLFLFLFGFVLLLLNSKDYRITSVSVRS